MMASGCILTTIIAAIFAFLSGLFLVGGSTQMIVPEEAPAMEAVTVEAIEIAPTIEITVMPTAEN